MSSPPEAPVAEATAFASLDARLARAVEAMAASDPAPADPFRGLYISDEQAAALAGAGARAGTDARLADAAARLGLDALDAAVLALCSAPELDPRYGRLYGYLHDDVTRKLASPRLAGRLLESDGVTSTDVHARLARDAPLRRLGALRLLDADGAAPVAERPLKVADRLASFLLGARLDSPGGDERLRRPPAPRSDPGRADVVARVASLLAACPEREGTGPHASLPVVVAGPDAAALVALAVGRPLLLARLADLTDADVLAQAALRCALEGRALCFDGLEQLEPADRVRVATALEERREPTIIVASSVAASTVLGDCTTMLVEAAMPGLAEREAAWTQLSACRNTHEVAAKFRLSMGQIAAAAEAARMTAAARGAVLPAAADLESGARQASSSRLGELASRMPPSFRWPDLIVPERQKRLLRSIAGFLRHRDRVLSEWGYERTVARNQGLKALFAGESGTGKTLAAQVLSAELGLELYRVDLATVVSKYIGETEKNLDRIFAAAEGSNAILFFDEADALFGKRSEVSDAHDRYANLEVAYLLQKMEGYAGVVILATNFRRNIDDAFTRRLDFVVDFPFPEAEDRRRLWRLLLPEEAPVGSDVDLPFLASRFKLSGGAIRNCTLSAGFEAAEDGDVIEMRHLVRAVAHEYAKQGRLTLEADFERFHGLLRLAGAGA